MISHYIRRSLAIGVPGLLLQIVPALHHGFPPHGEWLDELIAMTAFAGSVMLVVGLCYSGYYALAKGYSKWLGLLRLLSCIGLIVLACLPDRAKTVSFVTKPD